MKILHPLILLLTLMSLTACSSTSTSTSAPSKVTVFTNGVGLVGVDLGGETREVDQSFAQGKSVVLVFWQSWCMSCLKEAPHVEAASKAYADQIDFYGVVSGPDASVDEVELRDTVRKLGLSYPQIRDRDGSWSKRFQVTMTPTVLVFSADGVLRYTGNRLPEDWQAALGQ